MRDLAEDFNKIMKEFDFDRVHKVMVFMDWKWAINGGMQVPSIDDMQEFVCRLFDNALKSFEEVENIVVVSGGGFQIEIYSNGFIQLGFIVESKDSDVLDFFEYKETENE